MSRTSRASVKSKRFRSKKHMAMVRSHGCCICKNPVCDAHHLRSEGHLASAALKNGDDFTIPLCRKHHDELHAFGDEKLFLDLHGIDAKLVLAQMKEGNDDV
jgi:hypothetical protein